MSMYFSFTLSSWKVYNKPTIKQSNDPTFNLFFIKKHKLYFNMIIDIYINWIFVLMQISRFTQTFLFTRLKSLAWSQQGFWQNNFCRNSDLWSHCCDGEWWGMMGSEWLGFCEFLFFWRKWDVQRSLKGLRMDQFWLSQSSIQAM